MPRTTIAMPAVADLSRRAFLELAGQRSLAAGLAASAVLAACRETADRSSALGLDGRMADTLLALIDEIVPAAEGRPAASQVGTLPYFELLASSDPALVPALHAAIQAVDEQSRSQGARQFSAVAPGGRAALVAAWSRSDPPGFDRLRGYVYEAYYLDAEVWQAIGYEPYPTLAAGPTLAPFDPTLLDRVRRMPRRWKEA